MKRLFFLLPIFVLLFSAVFILWWSIVSQPVDVTDNKLRAFVVPRGVTAGQVAQKLEKENLVRSALAFRFYTQLTGRAAKIQAGDYRLAPNLSLSKLVSSLALGPADVWVTIPEGLRREEVALRVAQGIGLENDGKLTFLSEFMSQTRDKEGFLFPDTYLFPRDATASAVVKKLSSTFEKKVDENLRKKETIILGSIIERETLTSQERPIVAGILLKRLARGWPLEADATLQYIIGSQRCSIGVECNWWEPVKVEDRKVKSPYNTYTRAGLPPAPIANPGLASIEAVANPQTSPYWFYLHDRDGQVHYARTLEEHQENINKYLKSP